MRYQNRLEAGRVLSTGLRHLTGRADTCVLALPRGGVPVGFEVASELGLPLDVFTVRKVAVPGHEEVALGAIATGGVRVMNRDLMRQLALGEGDLERLFEKETAELTRREAEYRGIKPPAELAGRIAILVDDGLATGSTMMAAVAAARRRRVARVVAAVPVGSHEAVSALEYVADEVICPLIPTEFYAVGVWYEDFTQVGDEEVRALLTASAEHLSALDK